MSAGFPIVKADIDQYVGGLAWQLQETLRLCQKFKTFLDDGNNPSLESLGYTSDDANLIRAAFADADALAKVASGQQAQTPANNFLFRLARLVGIK